MRAEGVRESQKSAPSPTVLGQETHIAQSYLAYSPAMIYKERLSGRSTVNAKR